jgi:hypothetical protein
VQNRRENQSLSEILFNETPGEPEALTVRSQEGFAKCEHHIRSRSGARAAHSISQPLEIAHNSGRQALFGEQEPSAAESAVRVMFEREKLSNTATGKVLGIFHGDGDLAGPFRCIATNDVDAEVTRQDQWSGRARITRVMYPKEGSRSLTDLDGQKWKLLSDVFDGTLIFQRKEASRL